MDSSSLKTIISKRFDGGIIEINRDVFKVVSKFKGREFATYYFDCSKRFLSDEFDLLSYQKSLLSADYYSNTGPLQWNFYLYFITDVNPPIEKKIQIESDKSFTRKLVATQDEIVKLIEVQSKLKEQPTVDLDKALLDVWKSSLEEVGLSGIYLTKEYPKINDVFQLFLENYNFTEAPELERQVIPVEDDVSAIAHLSYNNFRCFSEEGKFTFKKVNLIKGVNGAGKTSLLEGIELCLCGQTIENTKKEHVSKLEVKYITGAVDKYVPGENKKFQERDRAWYGVNTLRGNTLSQGFHIYNFFDSETAFRFAKESNSGEIVRQIFSSIVLGEQANVIFDRIERFNDKLTGEIKPLRKDLKEKTDDRLLYQSKLKDNDFSSISIATLGEIISQLDRLRWSGTDLLLSEGANRTQFQRELMKVRSCLENALKSTSGGNSTLGEINSNFQKAKGLIKICDEFSNSFEGVHEQISQVSKSRTILDEQLKALNRSEKYYSVDEVGEIIKLESRINDLTRETNLIRGTVDTANELTEFSEQTFRIAFADQQLTLQTTENELAKLRKKSATLESTVGELNKLRTDLERIGTQYILLSGDDNHCPLCKTTFPNADILKTISSVETKLKEADLINSLAQQITEKNEKKMRLEKLIKGFSALSLVLTSNTSYSTIFSDTSTLRDITSKLTDLFEERDRELSRLKEAKNKFVNAGLNEIEFNALNAELSHVGIDEVLGRTDRASFVRKQNQLQTSQNTLLQNELNLRSSWEVREKDLIKSLRDHFKESMISQTNIHDYIDKLRSDIEKAEAALKAASEISALFPLDQDDNLRDVKSRFDEINELFDSYLETEARSKLKKEYLDKLESLKVSILGMEEKLRKYLRVNSILEDIINNNNRENYLKEFFIKNKESILDIFRVIHLPNEFDDIQFESSEAIKLKVKNSTESRDLTEISTGQKSAFILSLFLSLNHNLHSGPPLILFDDPVAYVDDINTLSFLDFLRDTVIAQDRQIFFATANGKLANLFQQKFDFLGDDFNIIKLDKVFT